MEDRCSYIGSSSLFTFDFPISYRSSLMTNNSLSSPEVVRVIQLIQGSRAAQCVGISATTMFIWDYGGLTNCILVEWLPECCISIGPVTMLDKEVSPNPLYRINDARYIIEYIRSNISGYVCCCHSFQQALILSDRTGEKALEMWAFSFLGEKWVDQLLCR